MPVEVINLILTVVAMAVTAGGSIMYMKTKITNLEVNVRELKKDLERSIDIMYSKVQLTIDRLEEEIKSNKERFDSDLKNKLANIVDGIKLNKESMEREVNEIRNIIDTGKDHVFKDMLEIKTNLNAINSDLKILENTVKNNFYNKDKINEFYVRNEIFKEKESIYMDKVNTTVSCIDKLKNDIDKLKRTIYEKIERK